MNDSLDFRRESLADIYLMNIKVELKEFRWPKLFMNLITLSHFCIAISDSKKYFVCHIIVELNENSDCCVTTSCDSK